MFEPKAAKQSNFEIKQPYENKNFYILDLALWLAAIMTNATINRLAPSCGLPHIPKTTQHLLNQNRTVSCSFVFDGVNHFLRLLAILVTILLVTEVIWQGVFCVFASIFKNPFWLVITASSKIKEI